MPTFEKTDRMLSAELVGAGHRYVRDNLYLSIYYTSVQQSCFASATFLLAAVPGLLGHPVTNLTNDAGICRVVENPAGEVAFGRSSVPKSKVMLMLLENVCTIN